MSDPLNGRSPDDMPPYAPNWARQQPGYRPAQPGFAYDAFSDEENPSYRSMAQMFAPEQERPKKRPNSNTKMLLRFGIVIGVVAAALALFVGYVGTQRGTDGEQSAAAERFKGVTNAVAAIQAAITPAPIAEAPPLESKPAEKPAERVVKTVPVKPLPAEQVPAEVPPLPSARAAAPEPAPSDHSAAAAPAEIKPTPASAPQVAALPKDIQPAPLPEPAAPPAPDLSPSELATLMARGRRFVESGDFSSARPVYRRAAEAGYAEAALALGETYDPVALQRHGVIGMSPDVEQARHWYERARELGSLEAPTRLERLAAY